MSEINWNAINPHQGSKRDSFEELCAQLARAESPLDAKFIRTGSPDAGVECYCVLPNGEEWGWQAKYFTSALGTPQWQQLDRSVRSALTKHPKLTRYFVCVPRDPSDGRIENQKNEMNRWNDHLAKWQDWATERDMSVEFVWWGSSELIERLSDESQAGRVEFWFGDQTRFSREWFRKRLDEARASAGRRYTPEVHIDVSVAEKLRLFGREEGVINGLRTNAKDVQDAFRLLKPRTDRDDAVGQESGLHALEEAGERIRAAFQRLEASPDKGLDLGSVVEEIHSALKRADESIAAISTLETTAQPDPAVDPDHQRYQPNPYSELRSLLYYLHGVLRNACVDLERAEPLVNGNLLILTGEAGIGKTHLLCDIAHTRVESGMPTVLLMGQLFQNSARPWPQILAQLDSTHIGTDVFIGALETAAQAANARALLMIDAVNEGEGLRLWPKELPGFLTAIRRSPWIACVLSVRSTYADVVIPEQVWESAVTVTHGGFADRTYDAARTYFEHYEVTLPSRPLLQPEFDNPLFLKLFCQSLQGKGTQEIQRGQYGISEVFRALLDDVNQRLGLALDYNPDDNPVQAALSAFAAESAKQRKRWLPQPEVAKIIDSFLTNSGFSTSLYRALVNEGLLFETPEVGGRRSNEKIVMISFERFGDHLIAQHLIESQISRENPAAAFQATGNLAFLLDEQDFIWRGVLEALCIQIPEEFDTELPELMPTLFDSKWGRSAFLASLTWRSRRGCSDDTRNQFIELIQRKDGLRRNEVFGALLAIATIPDHPLNAEYLDELLRRRSMTDRDALWSTYLHEAYTYESGGPVDRLVDWANELSMEARYSLEDNVVDLAATTLAWMLTTSNRFVRDRATKGLVRLLTGRLAAATRLVERFRGVDDLYVVERVYAVAYGVATRCHETEDIQQLATVVYDSVFAGGEPTPHILLRDYARGVVERALYLEAEIDVDIDLIRPPYRSKWPHIPSEDELKLLAPKPDVSNIDRFAPERAENFIHFSVTYGDFASYVIGTNHNVIRWIAPRLDEEPWKSPQEEMSEFRDTLTSDMKRMLADYESKRSMERRQSYEIAFTIESAKQRESEEQASQNGDVASDLDVAHSDAEKARGDFLVALNQRQRDLYVSIEDKLRAHDERFDLSVVQRYVLHRTFELGWTAERFGEFDVRVNYDDTRDSHKPERIGKKYQWIAYHEILAYISDHHQFDGGYSGDLNRHRYVGPWQIYRRDIDPTAPIHAGSRAQASRATRSDWWSGEDYSNWRHDLGDHEWLDLHDDIRFPPKLVQVRNPENGTGWLNLRALRTWRKSATVDLGEGNEHRREVWTHANAYLVEANQAEAFCRWAEEVDSMGHWMPEPHPDTDVFLGEHGWSRASLETLGADANKPVQVTYESTDCPTPVFLTACEYLSEAAGYDCSIEVSHNFLVPHPLLISGMQLRWFGNDADFCDNEGRLAAFDPDPTGSAASLLVREDLLAQFLEREGLALVWTVLGEKMIVGGWKRGGWRGSLRFTGAYRYDADPKNADRIRGALSYRLKTPESPAD